MARKHVLVPICSALLAGLLGLGSGMAHAEVDALVRQALSLTEAGQHRQAYELLEPHEVHRAGDPDFDLVFGIAANQSGEHARAVMALERATIVQPGNARARAELGRAMFAVGDSSSARTLLEQAKAGAPPEAALTIDQFLRAIDIAEAEMRTSGRAYAEFGIGHDSNISTGPTNANVAVPALGGQVFTLNNNSVKRDATFAHLAVGASGRYVLDSRWSLIGSAGATKRANRNESDFNNDQFDLTGGVSYRVDRQEYSLALVYQDYDTSLPGSSDRTQRGLIGEWAYRFDDGNREAGAYLQYSRLHYPTQSIRDADRAVLGGSYAQRIGNGWLAWGGVYFGNEDERTSTRPDFGHSLGGLRVGVQKSIRNDLSGFASASYERRSYGGQDPAFLVKRKDNQTTFSLGLNWVPVKTWRVTPLLSYVRNDSSVVVYDYNRTMVAVSVRKEF